MKSICFIGARGGSKGISRKNVIPLAGKPLIAYAVESALDSDLFENVIVSTEDNEIARIAKNFGAEVPFTRPKSLATDSAQMSDVLLHGIKKLCSMDYKFDCFVSRDCTVPFIRIKDIAGTIKLLIKEKCDAVFGVYPQHFNPYFNMMEKNKQNYLRFCKKKGKRPRSRQESPTVYQLNGLFTYDTKKFLKSKNLFMPKTLAFEIPMESAIMIDTEFEFRIAEMMVKEKLIKNF